MKRTIFLIGSRTGGPLIPLLGLKDELLDADPDLHFIIIGIHGGFEEEASVIEKLQLLYLPEVKGRPTPPDFGKSIPARIFGKIMYPFAFIAFFSILSYSVLKSIMYIKSYKPALILSMSNFLSVPVIWAAVIVNLLSGLLNKITGLFKLSPGKRVKIALHQLDIQNFTVKLTGRFADLLTSGFNNNFQTSKGNYKLVPNPVRYKRFDSINKKIGISNLKNQGIIKGSVRNPLLLIFGGGSGAEFINLWVFNNIKKLTEKFHVIHLTGYLQNTKLDYPVISGYNRHKGLTDLMPSALIASDVVIARAGMSTISELLYLKKNAYLIPIPDSHQEYNALAVKMFFRILHQKNLDNWLSIILEDLNTRFPEYNKVIWDYFSDSNKYQYRNMVLELLSK